MGKRILVGLGVAAAVLWLASASLYWWGVGASSADLAPGLVVAPVEIPSLPGDFDFVFIDPGVPLNKRVLDLVYDRLPAGGLVVAHNAFGFRLSEPAFRRAIRDDPRLETTIVPTLSGGLSITTKK